MSNWTADWSGCYPHVCSGEWSLYKDNILVADATTIPFGTSPANTCRTYSYWSFTDDWSEAWYNYEDGLVLDDWIYLYADWLFSIADPSEWASIYEAFRKEDWRHGCCGGCM